jgi:hypothetical protein
VHKKCVINKQDKGLAWCTLHKGQYWVSIKHKQNGQSYININFVEIQQDKV